MLAAVMNTLYVIAGVASLFLRGIANKVFLLVAIGLTLYVLLGLHWLTIGDVALSLIIGVAVIGLSFFYSPSRSMD